jgi:thiamine-monophosphate kinase
VLVVRDELAAIARLKAIFHTEDDDEIAIGDDAATIASPKNGRLVWTIDEQVQNTHFRTDWLSWHDVGWRSFIAAASDVAAMGGVATRALSAIAVPKDFRDEDFDALTRGQSDAAAEIGCKIVGGNLARANEAHVTTTVIGICDKPILRSGAIVGDDVWVAGAVGLAGLGLRALERHVASSLLEAAVLAWRHPTPRFDAAKKMAAANASAAIDLSDGLARDLAHVATASNVRIALDEAALIAHGDFYGTTTAANLLEEDLLEAILLGGEDYALIATSRSEIPGFFRIGSVCSGNGVTCGGNEIKPRGFDHFA